MEVGPKWNRKVPGTRLGRPRSFPSRLPQRGNNFPGMTPSSRWISCVVALALLSLSLPAPATNPFTYLDEADPFYPSLAFPKLTTPQWIGEAEVEAVVILSIDDLRDPKRYETFLRPILERLKQIDGRAPASILVNAVAPTNAALAPWLQEGVSLEVHTLAHPCPCLAKGNFDAAANTYHGGVELLNQIPGSSPVAFRMPCCDSMNSPSPRFYAEIFNRTNAAGQFLTIDSSVMILPTTNDPALPRELVLDANGHERFRKYFPTATNATTRVSLEHFATTIEDYPYPYVIGKLGWEFPAMVPSDWEAFNLHGSTNATTLADWKAALDVTVIKQGVMTIIFHPHGWSSPEQFVEFIDYAVSRHGRKVKFLNFREAQARLDKNLLTGHPLRAPNGRDNGARLLDLNHDGFLDVVLGSSQRQLTRVWQPQSRSWIETNFLTFLTLTNHAEAGVRFGVLGSNGPTVALVRHRQFDGAWRFEDGQWVEDKTLLRGLELEGQPLRTADAGRDLGVRFRDVDNDGVSELLVSNPRQNAVFIWSASDKSWQKLGYVLPRGAAIVDAEGRDAGLRFVDVNQDGYADVLVANEAQSSLHLFVAKSNERLMWEVGWHDEVFTGPADASIPKIVRAGTQPNNGVWFRHQTMWAQNEDTAHLPAQVERRTFRQLLDHGTPPSLSPTQSLAAIQLRPGFSVELVAAEPLVQSPVAFDWSADGRLWVVEMRDYPLGLDNKGQPGGRIKVLEDLDGDGRYDKATVFLDNVPFPTGVMPWRRGVIFSAAPHISYAEDTDGDGKADVVGPLFTGFTEGNQQHRLNGFDYGLDGWIYGANGDSGGKVQSVLQPDASPVSISGRDFRFRPDTSEFEAVEGQTQFGRRRDDWGNWFGNANYAWLWHYYISERDLARNPHLTVRSARQSLAAYPEATRLYPASRTRPRFNDKHHFQHVTSACSPTPYRDDLFGPDFATSVFISDPVHNLVHRELLEPNGTSFTSHRAADEATKEFLASADPWFRPTMLKTGPDGALYVADFYRLVLEHPEWIPKFILARLDVRTGADKGRIYRVFPTDRPPRKIPKLDQLSPARLVAALDSPSGWQRDNAQRLLIEAADESAQPMLEQLVAVSTRPKARLQALWTLEGMGALRTSVAMAALRDSHPAVRASAVRFVKPTAPIEPLLALAEDSDVKVRGKLALALGEWSDPRAGQTLVRLALKDAGDPHLQTAVLTSSPRHVGEMLAVVFANRDEASGRSELGAKLISLALAMNDQPGLTRVFRLLAEATPAERNFAAFTAFLDALDGRGVSLEQFSKEAREELRAALAQMQPLFTSARNTAGRADAPEAARLLALPLLARQTSSRDPDIALLGRLLGASQSTTLQRAALAALARQKDGAVAETLLAGWRGGSPALRNDVIETLLSRPPWALRLLQALEQGEVPPRQIDAAHQQKLFKHSQESVRARAKAVFATASVSRAEVLQQYADLAKFTGDAARGLALFQKNCVSCHRLRGEGSAVGPDLGSVADKSSAALLVAILDPNQAVEWRYVNYAAETKDEREISGIMADETPGSITLRGASAREETLLRSDLKNLRSSGLSLMPEGFEQMFQPQDMADLIAVLQGK